MSKEDRTAKISDSSDDISVFRRRGFMGPVRVLHASESRRIAAVKGLGIPKGPWFKSIFTANPAVLEIANSGVILNRIKALIGDDVMLWGAVFVKADPGHLHRWHADIETAYAQKTCSVWIGLENVDKNSSLKLMSGSHRFGKSVQEVAFSRDLNRLAAGDEIVLSLAKEFDPNSAIEQPDVKVGEAIFFDGQMWHASHNLNPEEPRLALLLQYATPQLKVRHWESIENPYLSLGISKPPCILMSGIDRFGYNLLIENRAELPRPHKKNAGSRFIGTQIKQLKFPLAEDKQTGWASYPLLNAITLSTERMGCHISVLSPGIQPHEPHVHLEEEILVMLSGEAELILAPDSITGREVRKTLKQGQLIYYPAFFRHSICNRSKQPITYLMFRWQSMLACRNESAASVHRFDVGGLVEPLATNRLWSTRPIFNFPTRHFRRVHAHLSVMKPGASYAAHRDHYDVAILVLEGVIETCGRQIEPFGFLYHSAGELHGIKNAGNTQAKYLVFEFESGPSRRKSVRILLQLFRILRGSGRSLPRYLFQFFAIKLNNLFTRKNR